jgi:hypothetical protein
MIDLEVTEPYLLSTGKYLCKPLESSGHYYLKKWHMKKTNPNRHLSWYVSMYVFGKPNYPDVMLISFSYFLNVENHDV